MGVDIVSTVLPGIGMCQEVTLHDGTRLGIVSRRNGVRDIVVYDEDGDGAAVSVTVDDDEANVIAELLGAPKLVARLAGLQREADAVLVEQLPVPAGSPFAGRPMGDTAARTRTGVSVVAVLRGAITHPSPTPDFGLHDGDLVVGVGTRAGLDQLARILDGSQVGTRGPRGG